MPLRRKRTIRLIGVAAAVLGMLGLVSSTGASTPAFSLTLTPTTAGSAAQGTPFTFHAVLSSQQSYDGFVDFNLQPTGKPAARVTFEHATMSVSAGEQATYDPSVTTSKWFAPVGSYQVVVTVNGAEVGSPLTFTVGRPPLQVPVFKDVTVGLGLAAPTPQHVCTMQDAGAAWADVNGDGKLDLFVARGSQPAELFINRGKRGFVNEAAARGVAGDGTFEYGGVFADYNNDGHPDLYVVREGTDILYKNDGTGHFKDVTAQTGVGGGDLSHRSASWGDYDNDGRLDLYVTTYGNCYGPAQPDELFHQNANGTFTDVSSLIKPALPPGVEGRGFQAAWFDYNGDGRQDLYLANDHYLSGADGNRLFRNDGPAPGGGWRFTDVTAQSGTGFAMNSMGIGIGDYNRDGRLDLAVSNIFATRLLRNNGNGTFTDVAKQTGADNPYITFDTIPTMTWGTIFGDFNLDGWEDLYQAAGWIETQVPGNPDQHNLLLVNDHGQRFLNLGAPSHTDDPGWSRGVSTADYNRDGRLDLLVVDQQGSAHLYENVTPRGRNHWLEIKTIGTRSNRDGCGTRVLLSTGSKPMVREVFCGSVGLDSGSDETLHFGLGTLKVVPKVTVFWPSGLRQTFRKVRGDRLLTITEPKV